MSKYLRYLSIYMGTREVFQENLKYYRKQKGLTQEQLSELIESGVTYIGEIETRHKFPRPETIDRIAEQLDIEPYQLFQEDRAARPLSRQEERTRVLAEKIYAKVSQNLYDSLMGEIPLLFTS